MEEKEKHICNTEGYAKISDIHYGNSYTDIVIIYCTECDKIEKVEEY